MQQLLCPGCRAPDDFPDEFEKVIKAGILAVRKEEGTWDEADVWVSEEEDSDAESEEEDSDAESGSDAEREEANSEDS